MYIILVTLQPLGFDPNPILARLVQLYHELLYKHIIFPFQHRWKNFLGRTLNRLQKKLLTSAGFTMIVNCHTVVRHLEANSNVMQSGSCR